MLGEETVLLKALEGKRGQPEQRPPHPAERGLFGMPTVVHNVQTLAAVPVDPRATAPRRSPRSAPTGSPGHDPRPGPDAGRRRDRRGPARDAAARRSSALGGGCRRGRSIKAVLVGGPSGGLLPPDLLDTPYDFEALRAAGAHVGSGSIVVADDRACVVDLARLLTRFCAERGVRQDDPVPDRDPPARRDRRPRRRRAARGRPTSTLLADLSADIVGSALCDHERLTTLPLASGMRYFRSELDEHILRSACPAGVCHPIAVAAGATHIRTTMADLITRPERRRPASRSPDTLAERLLDTQAPQRPQSTPRIRIEVDGRVVEGFEGQTILEVCRDNGIEIPTLCYEPKLPGFGACRMCVVEVEGEEHPPISLLARVRAGDEGPDPDRGAPPPAPDEPRADLLATTTPTACRPARTSARATSTSRASSRPNAEADWRESTRIFKRTIPFPSVLGRVCPAPCEEHCRRDEVDEAIAIRDSHRYAGDQVLKAMLDEGVDPPLPFERQAPSGRRAAVIGSGPAGMAAAYYLLLAGHDVTVFERDPAPGGMLRYGIPQYRLPKVEVLEAEYESVTRLGGKIVCNAGARARLHARRPDQPGLRRGRRRDRLLRHEQARHPGRGRRRGASTASSTCGPRRSACPTRTTPASASSSSAAASPRWTARGPRSARAPARSRSSTAAT